MNLKDFVKTVFRLRTMAVLIVAVAFHAGAYAQQTNVTINAEDRPVSWILSQITGQTGYETVFNDSFLDASRKVTMSFSDTPLETVMDYLCSQWNASYKIVDKTIVFSPVRGQQPEEKDEGIRSVSGLVVDEESLPVIGAVVMEQGTDNAATTDLDGKFTLECHSGNIVLFVSCLGYKDQSVRI